MEEFEFLLRWSSGPLLEAVEAQLLKMDEKAAEAEEIRAMEEADAAYEWHMECKGDRQREGG